MNIAILALIGLVSAKKTHRRNPTYQTARLDDQGFVVLGSEVFVKKESDWLANGDEKDDLEVQSEFDKEDPVVMDNGFALASGNNEENAWTANQYKGSLRDLVQLNANVNHKAHAKKESDWIANADAQDDKECESEMGDGSDEIVTDNGFALAGGNWADNKWTRNHYDPDLMFLQRQYEDHKQKKSHKKLNKKKLHQKKKTKKTKKVKKAKKPPMSQNVMVKKESDWIANADAADDKELESEQGDAEDEIVNDSGFALAGGIWADNNYKNDQYGGDLLFVQTKAEEKSKDLFLTEGFKEDHPNRISNAMYQKDEDGSAQDTLLVQMESMEKSGDLFLTEGFKEDHPNRIKNQFAEALPTDSDTMYAQVEQKNQDHFYTANFKGDHPNKVMNAFYARGEEEDVENMQFNEIDNYNPRAQARLAKYMEMM